MLRIDRAGNRLIRLPASPLAKAEHLERKLQEMIIASPEQFCEELGEKLWIVGQEIRPSDHIADRIDILAVDEDGSAVIIELKRGTHKLQLLQAISYAGMVSGWSEEQFVETLAENYNQTVDEARSDLQEHIQSELAGLNEYQRIILIAEDFDPALLISSQWLHEQYGVNVKCFRMTLSQEADNDYLAFTCIYPPVEIASLKRGDGKITAKSPLWEDWGSALEKIDNPSLIAYCQGELSASKRPEERLQYREMIYRIGGKRRLFFHVRTKYAYVWQEGRFDADEQFWKARLSDPDSVQPVKGGHSMRFHLYTVDDFSSFGKAARTDLVDKKFSDPQDFEGPPGQGSLA